VTGGDLVVVGASLAGLRAVEAARKAGHRGRITLIGEEPHLPYNRPPLSKGFLGAGELPDVPWHRGTAAIDALDVDLRLGQRASELDTAERRVAVGEEWIPYQALIIATGAAARELPGTEGMAGVHTLRTVEDARAIRDALDRGARTVVVGAGFVGSEVAAAARRRGLPVTLVEAMAVPLAQAIGGEMGAAVSRLHEENGTELRCGVTVTGVSGPGKVERVHLSDGTVLDADLVVVGIGTVPGTGWLKSSTVDIENGVVCDATLNAGVPGVYAAGDVARWHSPLFGRSLRVEHWTTAGEQGALAARNALDPDSALSYESVPYFWSDCYDSKIQFTGVPDADEIRVVSGDLDSTKFTALYAKEGRLVGALTMNNPAHSAKSQALIAKRADLRDAVERFSTPVKAS
jgi:NADPH-dependent 2,4-dienoyl-CoA reductase/sulfur reductase-like enzyme